MRNYISTLIKFILTLLSTAWIGFYGWLERADGKDLFGLSMVMGDDTAYIAGVDRRDFVDIVFSHHGLATIGTCVLMFIIIKLISKIERHGMGPSFYDKINEVLVWVLPIISLLIGGFFSLYLNRFVFLSRGHY